MAARRVLFWVPGDPVALARARTGRRGQWYTPKGSMEAEQQVGLAWEAMGGLPFRVESALVVRVEAYCRRPKNPRYSWPARPDTDNLVKLVLDSLQKARAYLNDGQVVEEWCRKQWVDPLHPEPGCLVQIEGEE